MPKHKKKSSRSNSPKISDKIVEETPQKYASELCTEDMTFQDCELAILRQAVDETELTKQKEVAGNPIIEKMIKIVEKFLRDKKCVCYGGTAINNILPKESQFYNRDVEIPDYDFFSPTPLAHAKELADIFYKAGYTDVEAKSGVHAGTFKVFVNFIPMADITELHPSIFENMQKEALTVNKIKYAPANFLRMNMFLELSRPGGDVSRWEKVLKRLTLLNKHYPLLDKECSVVDFQRTMDSMSSPYDTEKLYYLSRDHFIDMEAVFFGGYASSLYTRYMPNKQRSMIKTIPDFDVLHEDPEKCAKGLMEKIKKQGFSHVSIKEHEEVGEIVPRHVEVKVGKDTICFIYKPVACHSYNELKVREKRIRVATIDTMLSFYLAFYYSGLQYHSNFKERLLCMSQFLFLVEQKNRLAQKGLLKRFSITCYGTQPTLESMRSEKAEKFKELKDKRNTDEYEYWFLRYSPGETREKGQTRKQRKQRKKSSSKKSKSKSTRVSQSSKSKSKLPTPTMPYFDMDSSTEQSGTDPHDEYEEVDNTPESVSTVKKSRSTRKRSKSQRTRRRRSGRKHNKQYKPKYREPSFEDNSDYAETDDVENEEDSNENGRMY